MVIGNGLVAKIFETYKEKNNIIIFASGVSNSKSNDANAYKREIDLIKQTVESYPTFTFVYFSTCSIYDPSEANSSYVIHKLRIEKLIKESNISYYIFRVSNLVGITKNEYTIINYLINNIQNETAFELWKNATRNLLDVVDMYKMVDAIINAKSTLNKTINVANPTSYLVSDIVNTIEKLSHKKANYTLVEKGISFNIEVLDCADILQNLHINFDENYLTNLLAKYFYKG